MRLSALDGTPSWKAWGLPQTALSAPRRHCPLTLGLCWAGSGSHVLATPSPPAGHNHSHVVGLEVSVGDARLVHVLQAQHHLQQQAPDLLLRHVRARGLVASAVEVGDGTWEWGQESRAGFGPGLITRNGCALQQGSTEPATIQAPAAAAGGGTHLMALDRSPPGK